ncbi:unnamed protein product [Phytophthora fragariaefolia]|uniref:Unnamed protein product n=1 Tax=Phytophthora fragariaefolia TaxID=1490495 RepID=A0A9W7DAZ3_9STRA|nr:unnamed protein product [Phytophthora fragariaefolia]
MHMKYSVLSRSCGAHHLLTRPQYGGSAEPPTALPPRVDRYLGTAHLAAMADPNAKLNSLFGKKKKKKSTTVNANVIVKTSAQNAERAAAAAAAAAPQPAPKPAAPAATASGKVLSDLSLNKEEQEEKTAFQWAKQPKKYKNADEKEAVASTWAEQEERNRVNRRIQLGNERAFPSLGADSTKAQLQSMKAPSTKAVKTKNVWASLHDDEEED